MSAKSVLGVWGAASRPQDAADRRRPTTSVAESGPWVQVSRLGNPLFNEVDRADGREGPLERAAARRRQASSPSTSSSPSSAKLLPVLYPGVFPNLAALTKPTRADLVAILLTGLPAGIVPGFQNFTGKALADMLRLNVAIPPDVVARTRSGCSAATWPGSRTGGGSPTTS